MNAAQLASCGSLLSLTQALVGPGVAGAPRLLVVTAGAQAPGAGPVAVRRRPLLGLARTIALEHPELRVRCIDLDPADGAAAGDLLAELLAGDTRERGRVPERRAARGPAGPARRRSARADRQPALQLVNASPGTLDGLELRPLERRPPGPGEVEIEVQAVGLNFKDVLNALDLYPGDPGPLGSECAGVVTAVGPGVQGLAPGAPVVAVAAGSFATHVTLARGPRGAQAARLDVRGSRRGAGGVRHGLVLPALGGEPARGRARADPRRRRRRRPGRGAGRPRARRRGLRDRGQRRPSAPTSPRSARAT